MKLFLRNKDRYLVDTTLYIYDLLHVILHRKIYIKI